MMKRARPILAALGVALLLLGTVVLVRAGRSRSRQPPPASGKPALAALDEAAAVQRLRRAVQFATISYSDPARRPDAAFIGLRDYLAQAFPRAHAALQREVVAGHSLFYTWRGSQPALPPLLLMGHIDVVPLEPGTEARWTVPAFAGEIRDGYLWGRGTMDDKAGVVSTLEAIEGLLGQGFAPRRTLYLAFGHDEEAGGTGAAAMARLVRERGPAPVLVMDEGLAITQGLMPGVSGPVALLGTGQKGYLSVELRVAAEGGHSSMPPPRGAVFALAQALVRLEEHPFPAQLRGPADEMFDWMGPEMTAPLRAVMTNRWLFAPLVTRLLLAKPSTAALLRTTTALTMLQAGVKDNVLPTAATAVVNFRIRPSESSASVLAEVRRLLGPQVTVTALGTPIEPSRPSSPESPRFTAVARSLRTVSPQVLVAPALMLGYADARYYEGMTADIYRFRPMLLRGDDPQRIHGIDERLSLEDYARHVRFYAQVITDICDSGGTTDRGGQGG